MAQTGLITQAMLRHHQIINKLLLDSEKVSKNDDYRFVQLFNLFKWNLNKHIFIEEENLFPVADRTNRIELKQLNGLLKDHKDILKIVDNLDDEIADGNRPNTSVLRELLFNHEGREIDDFYPLLDNRLSIEKRKEILDKLKDVKLG
jgi:hypothetical protein